MRAGQEVIATGLALGVFSDTVTRGVVSAVRKAGPVLLIQADAAVNPGNSGGPLGDRPGVVIDVNSMRVAAAQGGEELALAVAIDHGKQLLSGDVVTSTMATPSESLNRLLTGSSETAKMRERGEQAYRHALGQAAQSASQLDSYWDRYAKSCVVTARHAGDRSWFAAFEADGVRISASSAYDCGRWLSEVRTHADAIRSAPASAGVGRLGALGAACIIGS